MPQRALVIAATCAVLLGSIQSANGRRSGGPGTSYPFGAYALTSATSLPIDGHGRGHGVGGSIAGYVNRAIAGQTADQMLAAYYPGTSTAQLAPTATVRVGLLARPDGDIGTVHLAGGGGSGACASGPWSSLQVTGAGLDVVFGPDDVVAIHHQSGQMVLQEQTPSGDVIQQWTTTGDLMATSLDGGPVRVLDLSPPCYERYRGSIVVHWSDHGTPDTSDDQLWAINVVTVDSYVAGVAEGPPTLPTEAARALSVTARTYAWNKVQGSKFQVDGFDISSSSEFLPPGWPGGTQLYLGYDAERPAMVAAAAATSGSILTYADQGAILATYSPNAGPVTGDPGYEFGFPTPIAYLTEHADPYYAPDGDASWTRAVDPATAAASLGLPIGDMAGYSVASRTPGGRPSVISVIGTEGTFDVPAPAFGSALGLPSDFVDVPVARLAGADRAATAVAVSQETTPGQTPTVVIAGGDDSHLVDALVAGPLAKARGASLLLSVGGVLSDATVAEIDRLGATHAVIVGGRAAVPDGVADQLTDVGLTIERIAGSDRFATAVYVADSIRGATIPSSVVLASGDDGHLVDALAAAGPAAGIGAPIVLTAANSLPISTATFLALVQPPTVVVVGGPEAVSDQVMGEVSGSIRVSGPDRYATSTALAAYFSPKLSSRIRRVCLASGEDGHLADALAASSLGGLVLLSPSAGPATGALDYITSTRLSIGRMLVLGGTDALADSVLAAASDALNSW